MSGQLLWAPHAWGAGSNGQRHATGLLTFGLTFVLTGVLFFFHSGYPAMLEGRVDNSMQQKAQAAIARGEKVVTLDSEWRTPEGNLASGGVSNIGWLIGEAFRQSGIKVRCVGLCNSAAAHILIASRGCIVGPRGRIVLHVPELPPSFGPVLAERVWPYLVQDWRNRMAQYGVPDDIVTRTINNPRGVHELSTSEMKRIGCQVE